jgi:AraC-like DNA-binding protein
LSIIFSVFVISLYIRSVTRLINSILAWDSAENNLIKYQELSSKRVADFVNTQDALESAYNQIIELELIKKRNKIILILILVLVIQIVIIISCLLVNSLNKKVKTSSAELVKKNLTQLNYEEKVNDLIKKQINSSENRSDILYEKFNSWLEKEKKYLQPDIDLNMAAREIGTNRSYLSKSINQHGIGFNEIINRYRIREVIRIFENENEERNSYTLQKLATAVGFNTKSVRLTDKFIFANFAHGWKFSF